MKLPPHKCELCITHNQHRSYYEKIADFIGGSGADWPSEEAKARAIATDEIWTIQWYPDTPISFHLIAAPTLEEALAFANSKA